MGNKMKILIADDENPARERLKSILIELDYKICGEAENGDEVITKIISLKPQLVFLDINMPGINIFEMIKSLKEPPLIIFQTAYSEYAVEAFNIDAIDYLLKPYSKDRVKTALDKAERYINNQLYDNEDSIQNNSGEICQKYLTVKFGNSIKLINNDEIIRICFEEGFSFIYTDEGRFLIDISLNELETILPDNVFFRTSRNDVVKLSEITKIHPMFNGQYIIELKDKSKIHLSRRRARQLRQIIKF